MGDEGEEEEGEGEEEEDSTAVQLPLACRTSPWRQVTRCVQALLAAVDGSEEAVEAGKGGRPD